MLTLHGVSYLVGPTDEARRDLEVIARELHCDTVMLIGGDVPRLIAAARTALDLGLDVHLRPDATDMSQSRMLEMLAAVAAAAEVLRVDHAERVTLLVGSELSHAVPGIVPGLRSFLRLRLIIRHHRLLRRRIDKRLNRLLVRAAAVARRRFHGPLTYAAAGWEAPDWSLFDLVSLSLYRTARNRDTYVGGLRSLVRDSGGKPVVVSEFGCGAFTGADDRGAGSFQIVDWLADPPRIRGEHPRDEAVQARYLTELIDLYDAEGVYGCFVFTFVMPDFPHRDDPSLDLDKAGFGLIAVSEDGTRRRKAAFNAVADRFWSA
jgi:hypothetical protein